MLNRIHPLVIAILLLLVSSFVSVAAGCSSGGAVLPENTDSGLELEAASFEDGDNFVDLTGEGVTLSLKDVAGNPLSDIEVYLDGEIADYTNEDGEYTLYGLSETESELSFGVDGTIFLTTTIDGVTRQATGSDPDPDIDRGKVFGIVGDVDGPVPHALVIIVSGEHFAFTWSGPQGGYEMLDAPAGPGVIVCYAAQHKPYQDNILVFPNDPVQKNIFLQKFVNYAMLGGIVRDGMNWPVKHARVSYIRPDHEPIVTHTNMWGAYRFPHLPLGPGMILVQAFGFHNGGGPVQLHPGKNLKHWKIFRLPFGGIEGVVKGIVPGQNEPVPLPNATVAFIKHIEGQDDPIVILRKTDPLGRYRFNFLPLGPCVVKAGKPGFEIVAKPSFVAEGQWHVENFLLAKLPPDGGGGD